MAHRANACGIKLVFRRAKVAGNLAHVFEPAGLEPVVVSGIGERLMEWALSRAAPPGAGSGQE